MVQSIFRRLPPRKSATPENGQEFNVLAQLTKTPGSNPFLLTWRQGNTMKGGSREAGGQENVEREVGGLWPPPVPFPFPPPSPPPHHTLILSCIEFNHAYNQGVNAANELKASIISCWTQHFQNGKWSNNVIISVEQASNPRQFSSIFA